MWEEQGPLGESWVEISWLCEEDLEWVDFRDGMDGLSYQVVSLLLNGEYYDLAFFLHGGVLTLSTDHGSSQVACSTPSSFFYQVKHKGMVCCPYV